MDAIIKDLGLLINATLIATPPLLLAALGSCFTERSGTVNIGIEGMMTIGAFTGAVVGLETGNGWLAFLCAGLAGAVLGVILAIACISFHADQTIAGTASLARVLPSSFARPCTITPRIHRQCLPVPNCPSCLTECSRWEAFGAMC